MFLQIQSYILEDQAEEIPNFISIHLHNPRAIGRNYIEEYMVVAIVLSSDTLKTLNYIFQSTL